MTNIDGPRECGIVITVKPMRRDGKYPVIHYSKGQGNAITKLYSADKVREVWDRAAKNPGLYTIRGVRP